VDRDPAVHEFLASVLRREGRSIEDAYDESAALDRIKAARYDLVVAGAAHNGDGLLLLRRFRQMRPSMRVILTAETSDPARVIAAIRERAYSYFHKPLPPNAVADMVHQALEASAWQEDIRVLSARPEWITVEIRCKIDAAERMVQFVREIESGDPPSLREDISTAFRELLMNAVEHGGKSDPRQRVRVSRLRTSRAIAVHIQDPGAGFSMDVLPHAAVANPEDSPIAHIELRAEQGRRPGGFGILMSRNLVDELIYNEKGNEVLFLKYLKS
jgi:anti-sigma regulatory factor (Ser/Thr protein kinase)/CheY-like chemotaxis protein